MSPTYPLSVPRKKVEESARCTGTCTNGSPCLRRAVYGDPPAFCWVCDPSEEGKVRRKQRTAKRPQPTTTEAKRLDEIRAEGTLDEIVRRALALSAKFEKLTASDGEKALAAQRITRAAATMFNAAISGLKARGVVGDLVARPKALGERPDPLTRAQGTVDALAGMNELRDAELNS